MPVPQLGAGGIMFSDCPSVLACKVMSTVFHKLLAEISPNLQDKHEVLRF